MSQTSDLQSYKETYTYILQNIWSIGTAIGISTILHLNTLPFIHSFISSPLCLVCHICIIIKSDHIGIILDVTFNLFWYISSWEVQKARMYFYVHPTYLKRGEFCPNELLVHVEKMFGLPGLWCCFIPPPNTRWRPSIFNDQTTLPDDLSTVSDGICSSLVPAGASI